MPPGPKAKPLHLSVEEEAEPRRWTRRQHGRQALATRARIVLACAAPGATNSAVARDLKVSRPSVIGWRGRFAGQRLAGLSDAPRPGAPRTVGDAEVERLVALTLASQPKETTHGSTRTMAARAGLSQTMVSRVWRAFGLQPHRAETFKLSSDPAFVDKVRDVVGLHLRPPDRALVLGVDEKPQIQALERTAPVLPMRPGPARTAHPRRPTPRHPGPLRRPGRAGRHGHRLLPETAPQRRVPCFP